jgi:HD containing hydrolase-like enzyme
MKREDILRNPRYAGLIKRYHTWPTITTQTVGEHTWQVLRIYWQIFGPLPPEISTYILWHDAGELKTGDSPFPLKHDNPNLKKSLDWLEDEAVVSMGGPVSYKLEPVDNVRCKICDLIEMLEYGLDETMMGNRFAQPIVNDIARGITELLGQLDGMDQERVKSYLDKRTPKCT